jgi:hypothetical protein
MTEVDKDAFRRAIEQCRAHGIAESEYIDRELASGESFEEVGKSAAYGCQCRNLRLKPWQAPPMFGDAHPGHEGHADAEVLLQKLLDAGLSRYEPDPIRALETATTKPAA